MRRLTSIGLAGFLAAVVLLLLAAPAGAHAYLSTSTPTDGAVLNGSPTELQLGFSESVVLGATKLELVDDHGNRYQPTNLRIVSSSGDGDTEEPVTLFAALPLLPRGAYRLSWSTLSSDDLHRTSGVVVFGVGQSVVAAGTKEPRPPQNEVGLRWLLFTGFALAAGGLLAAQLARRRGQDLAVSIGCYRLAAVAATGTAVAAAVLLVLQSGSTGVGTVLSGRYGEGWLTREIGLGLLATVALSWWRRRPTRAAGLFWPAALIAIAMVAIGSALVGHSANGGPTYLTADAAHLIATAAWTGCPAVLLLVARRQPATLRAALLGFAWPATACVGTIIITGVYLTSGVVGSVDAAVSTFYGRALLVKLGLFGIVAGLGLLNFRLLRRRPVVPVRRTVLVEAAVAVLVLGVAAVLTSSQPAREPEFVRVVSPATTSQDGLAADLQQTLSIKPNLPGKNVVVLGIFDTRRPAPGEISQVLVQITDASGSTSSVPAQALADHAWTAPVQLTASGRTSVRITVVRPGLASVRSTFAWSVRPAPRVSRPVILSQAPIRSPLQRLAIIAIVGAAAAGLIGWRRRGRNAAPEGPPTDGKPVEELVPT